MAGQGGQPLSPKAAPGAWASSANCLGLPSEWFFPAKYDGEKVGAAAKEVCARCVVRVDCLEYALTVPVERIGVWGGTGARERERIIRRRRMGLAQ